MKSISLDSTYNEEYNVPGEPCFFFGFNFFICVFFCVCNQMFRENNDTAMNQTLPFL